MLGVPHLRGPLSYRRRAVGTCVKAIAATSLRRLSRGPRLPGWNWAVELGTAVLRAQLEVAFSLEEVAEQRRFLDTLVLDRGNRRRVHEEKFEAGGLRGTLFVPERRGTATILYLHGGGFAFYPQEAYAEFMATFAKAARARTFALDYSLAPEKPFPCALDEACNAYRWLIDHAVDPREIVIAGDSAGGNLTISMLCELRASKMPQPALGVALSPATDFENITESMTANDDFDWISGKMADQWRDWYCPSEQRREPRVSPIFADLTGLAPIYMQAGKAEILYGSIVGFSDEALRQGANVTLEAWDDMNHVFQLFGDDAPQSREALRRIGEEVQRHTTF